MEPLFLETKYASYYIKDGIMEVVFTPNIVISIDVAKQIVEDRLRFTNGKTWPLLVDIKGLVFVDTVSRKYFATAKALQYVSAGALVAGSLISRLAGSIYIKIDKPVIPAKLFTDKAKALKWLKKMVK